MPTLAELAAELGIPEDTLAAKSDVVNKWNGYLSQAETAQSTMADAQKKLQEAQQLQAVIDENIKNFGMTEANVAQLQANNAALKAALDEVKKAGFNGINVPELPTNIPAAKSPDEQFRENVVRGFTNVTQAMAVQNRYFNVFGKAMPDDPARLADEAAAQRMSITDYAERKYGFRDAEQKAQSEARQKELDAYAERKVKEWQEAHPSTAGNPNLNGGVPSQYPSMPKPREAKDIRSFAGMSARDKIASAMQRATQAAAGAKA